MNASSLLWVVPFHPKKRGSLEEQLAALGRALRSRGVSTTLVLWKLPPPAVATLFAEAGLDVRTLDFGDEWAAARQLLWLALTLRPRIAHLHFVRPASPVALLLAASGARVILNEHIPLQPGHEKIRSVIKHAGHRALSPLWFARVAVSRHVADTLEAAQAVPPWRLRVIENGIDLSRFDSVEADRDRARHALGIAPGERVIACVARMSPEKGVDVALRALARMNRPKPLLLVVGDGPDAKACADLAGALGVADRVRFLGVRDDVERVLASCDQAWCPSRMEAFGLAAAEAMAAARPVIASRTGGLPEVVRDGETGVLVPPGDDAALAAAAEDLLSDPVRADALGRAARVRARAYFSMERFVERVLALYAEADPAFARTVDAVDGRAARIAH